MSVPTSSTSNQVATPLVRDREGSSVRRVEDSVMRLGGFALLAFGLLNGIRILLSNGAGFDPEASLSRMSQLIFIFPILLAGPILIFSPPGAVKRKSFRQNVARLLVLLMAITFLLFIPLSLYHYLTLLNLSASQPARVNNILQRRKAEILSGTKKLKTPEDFLRFLAGVPEIRNIEISRNQSPEEIRRGISRGIDEGIKAEIERTKNSEQQRIVSLNIITRDLILGSLLAGSTFLVFSSYLHPWLFESVARLMPSKTHGDAGVTANESKSGRRRFSRFLTRYFIYLKHDVLNSLPGYRKRSSRSSRR